MPQQHLDNKKGLESPNKVREINNSFKLNTRGICDRIKKIMLILDERKLVEELNRINKSKPLYDSGTDEGNLRIKLAEDIATQREELKQIKWKIKFIKKHSLFSIKGNLYLELGKLISYCQKDGYIEYKDGHNKKLYVSLKGLKFLEPLGFIETILSAYSHLSIFILTVLLVYVIKLVVYLIWHIIL